MIRRDRRSAAAWRRAEHAAGAGRRDFQSALARALTQMHPPTCHSDTTARRCIQPLPNTAHCRSDLRTIPSAVFAQYHRALPPHCGERFGMEHRTRSIRAEAHSAARHVAAEGKRPTTQRIRSRHSDDNMANRTVRCILDSLADSSNAIASTDFS